jgi:serine/threonine protein phosphatase PrpC
MAKIKEIPGGNDDHKKNKAFDAIKHTWRIVTHPVTALDSYGGDLKHDLRHPGDKTDYNERFNQKVRRRDIINDIINQAKYERIIARSKIDYLVREAEIASIENNQNGNANSRKKNNLRWLQLKCKQISSKIHRDMLGKAIVSSRRDYNSSLDKNYIQSLSLSKVNEQLLGLTGNQTKHWVGNPEFDIPSFSHLTLDHLQALAGPDLNNIKKEAEHLKKFITSLSKAREEEKLLRANDVLYRKFKCKEYLSGNNADKRIKRIKYHYQEIGGQDQANAYYRLITNLQVWQDASIKNGEGHDLKTQHGDKWEGFVPPFKQAYRSKELIGGLLNYAPDCLTKSRTRMYSTLLVTSPLIGAAAILFGIGARIGYSGVKAGEGIKDLSGKMVNEYGRAKWARKYRLNERDKQKQEIERNLLKERKNLIESKDRILKLEKDIFEERGNKIRKEKLKNTKKMEEINADSIRKRRKTLKSAYLNYSLGMHKKAKALLDKYEASIGQDRRVPPSKRPTELGGTVTSHGDAAKGHEDASSRHKVRGESNGQQNEVHEDTPPQPTTNTEDSSNGILSPQPEVDKNPPAEENKDEIASVTSNNASDVSPQLSPAVIKEDTISSKEEDNSQHTKKPDGVVSERRKPTTAVQDARSTLETSHKEQLSDKLILPELTEQEQADQKALTDIIDKFKNKEGVDQKILNYAQTFIDDNYLYTACKIIEDLKRRGEKLATDLKIEVSIDKDKYSELESIKCRYSGGDGKLSGAATLEKEVKDQNEYKHIVNEDAHFIDNNVLGVFDGAGGYSGGHIASAIAVDYLRKLLSQNQNPLSDNLPVDNIKQNMDNILRGINTEICKYQSEIYGKMASTASIVKIMKHGKVVIGHAGDCRVYFFEDKDKPTVKQLTLDNASASDSKEDEKKQWDLQKKMANLTTFKTQEECAYMLNRNVAPGLLGRNQNELKTKIYEYNIESSGMLAITSDGIHDNLTDEQIADYLSKNKNNTKEAANALVREAKKISDQYNGSLPAPWLQRPKSDDITAIVIDIPEKGDGRTDNVAPTVKYTSRPNQSRLEARWFERNIINPFKKAFKKAGYFWAFMCGKPSISDGDRKSLAKEIDNSLRLIENEIIQGHERDLEVKLNLNSENKEAYKIYKKKVVDEKDPTEFCITQEELTSEWKELKNIPIDLNLIEKFNEGKAKLYIPKLWFKPNNKDGSENPDKVPQFVLYDQEMPGTDLLSISSENRVDGFRVNNKSLKKFAEQAVREIMNAYPKSKQELPGNDNRTNSETDANNGNDEHEDREKEPVEEVKNVKYFIQNKINNQFRDATWEKGAYNLLIEKVGEYLTTAGLVTDTNAIPENDQVQAQIDNFISRLGLGYPKASLERKPITLPNGKVKWEQNVSSNDSDCSIRALLVAAGYDMGEAFSEDRVKFECIVRFVRRCLANETMPNGEEGKQLDLLQPAGQKAVAILRSLTIEDLPVIDPKRRIVLYSLSGNDNQIVDFTSPLLDNEINKNTDDTSPSCEIMYYASGDGGHFRAIEPQSYRKVPDGKIQIRAAME